MLKKIIIIWLLCVGVSWAKLVIVSPHEFSFETRRQWNYIGNQLDAVKSGEVILLWNGRGGMNVIAEKFEMHVEAAVSRGVKVKFVLLGKSVSNHANAVCVGTSYTMESGAMLIYHNQFDWFRSMLRHKKFYIRDENFFDKCISRGILTKSEVSVIVWANQRLEIDDKGHREFKPDWEAYW